MQGKHFIDRRGRIKLFIVGQWNEFLDRSRLSSSAFRFL
ncbi:hypothetical protein BFJ68_g213 [Fusarium oxysporum]|uniref:Uncharacterized protein n=2 Tax=Fusarium oxysporum TaxID=5507 RepID=A0A420S8P8_FUSOX|nr:hypothetical protein BFJ65_g10975 [Fusarium oxysporum f. sp. cepae]RKK24142.1 hypothetical protein BFJ67_g16774 [Fusarium oxysporum f. sp. cepae]RKK27012.1 hypothetical protein BFJ66_g16849 [Fusarium oxysporum f. sp. cepae]RKL25579.1 hypothetical protein BFJ68_g213 [Fusarium oxysporum]